MKTEFCNNGFFDSERKLKFHKRKMFFLTYLRDSLERRLSSVNASIDTLQKQIDRDNLNDA